MAGNSSSNFVFANTSATVEFLCIWYFSEPSIKLVVKATSSGSSKPFPASV